MLYNYVFKIKGKIMTNKQIETLNKLKKLKDSGAISEMEFNSEKQKILNDVTPENQIIEKNELNSGIRCPKCGSNNVQMINETYTTGKDFSGSNACCGWILLGPIGLLCGSCGDGKQAHNVNYWVCKKCGKKWRA